MGLEPDVLLEKWQGAAYLRISYRSVFRYVKQDSFPTPVRSDGQALWWKSDLTAWHERMWSATSNPAPSANLLINSPIFMGFYVGQNKKTPRKAFQ